MNLGGQDLGGRREEGKGTAVSGRPQFEVKMRGTPLSRILEEAGRMCCATRS